MKKKLGNLILVLPLFFVVGCAGMAGLVATPIIKPDPAPDLFHEIIATVAGGNTYDRIKYNCADFSFALADKLEQAGYENRVMWGRISENDERKHAWVRVKYQGEIVDIEATTGHILLQNESYIAEGIACGDALADRIYYFVDLDAVNWAR